ncbi:MAG TPA: iron-sulfur cluster assembly scaffold protein [Candidatus Eisenbacteria bacterium]|nr:iron-sulfur cluster assembly scaffold protein [Candidatus Eisenbacteria bacterium]
MYSPQLLDHFQNPRNAGDLPSADGTAETENPVCGDVIRLSLRIQSGRVAEIRFKAKGCVPAIACGSAVTELALGKTVAQARSLTPDDVKNVVGGVPAASNHAAELAIDVLLAALTKF